MISTVSAASPIALDAEVIKNEISSNEAASFTLNVNNNQGFSDQFLLSAPLTNWDVTFSDYIIYIPRYSSISVDLRAAPPMDSIEGTYALYIKVQSTENSNISNFDYVHVIIDEIVTESFSNVSISEEVVNGWIIDTYSFTIENIGTLTYLGSHVDYFSELEYLLLDSSNDRSVEDYGKDKRVSWEYSIEPNESVTISYSVSYIPVLISGTLLSAAIFAFLYFYLNRFNLTKSARRGKETIRVKLAISNKTNSEQDHIRIEDFIPKPFKLVKNFGTVVPSQIISTKSGTRLIWKFDSFAPQEERMLSYELKSEIHVIGNLQLPQAKLLQRKGKQILSKVFSGKIKIVGR
jgi:hypothetical protein